MERCSAILGHLAPITVNAVEHGEQLLVVGSYTKKMGHANGSGGGVSIFHLTSSGELECLLKDQDVGMNPSYIATHPKRRVFYCVHEGEEGWISSWKWDNGPNGFTLSKIGMCQAQGGYPCYLEADKTGRVLFYSNYLNNGEASCGMLEICKHTGSALSKRRATVKFTEPGSFVDAERQESPHAHTMKPHDSLPFVYCADLGTDKIHGWQYNVDKMTLDPIGSLQVNPGDGPRTLSFVQNRLVWTSELGVNVASALINPITGTLTLADRQPLSPGGVMTPGIRSASHIDTSPGGNLVYCSNRLGVNRLGQLPDGPKDGEITVHRLTEDGRLKTQARASTGGCCPRHFLPTPGGLVIANQEGNNVSVLTARGSELELTSKVELGCPACVTRLI